MKKEFETNYTNDFESIKHTDEEGREFWYARELMGQLGYDRWENFEKAVCMKHCNQACERGLEFRTDRRDAVLDQHHYCEKMTLSEFLPLMMT